MSVRHLFGVAFLLGCVESPAGRGALPLHAGDRLELVLLQKAFEPPPGADGAARFEVGWKDAGGAIRRIEGGPWLEALRYRDHAALVDDEERLWLVHPRGARHLLGTGVVGGPTVSYDARRLAWVERTGALRVYDGHGARTLARGLSSAGAMHFASQDTALRFVGASPGGIAGWWELDVASGRLRCLTNCSLRAGERWGNNFVPPHRGAP
ncbi:MAG: hypothetical protein NZ898_01525 [Myxococcota bacterium]|nr:hypothetical protein [Myxococcota bacterium]MDW8362493.1 hypothetical protein [Myxococcales bacterium]